MSAGVDVASWLASVAPEDLLPTRRRDEAQRIERPLTLVGSAWLDEAHGYAIVRDARWVTYGIPLAVGAGGHVVRGSANNTGARALRGLQTK